jgi:hypothetical protein
MPFRHRLRSSRRLQFLVNCPDMTADRAAKKPALNPKLLGERQYASLNIPTLRACKSARGQIESHIDEEVGTHDESPFSDGCSSCTGLGAGGSRLPRICDEHADIQRTYLANLCQLRSRDEPFMSSRTCGENCERVLADGNGANARREAWETWLDYGDHAARNVGSRHKRTSVPRIARILGPSGRIDRRGTAARVS